MQASMGDVFEFAIPCHPFDPQIRDLLSLGFCHGSGLWITQSSCSEPQAATETVAKSLFLIKSIFGTEGLSFNPVMGRGFDEH